MNDIDQNEHALPGRRARLKAFMSLKRQNTVLKAGVAAMAVVAAPVGLSMMDDDTTPEPVTLGKGTAGVDPDLTPRDLPPAGREVTAANLTTPDITGVDIIDEVLADGEDVVEDIADNLGIGEASYYGERFAGRPTANGETFDPAKMTAAHRTLPMGSKVRVTHNRTGKSIIVRINDRGPFHGNRVIDLSKAAAREIGMLRAGKAKVRLELLPKA
ncbi:MAG: septal ring lytic transglycosylase RlpA family protein [Pseudomonadota bacterium]